MALLSILQYPDPRLHQSAAAVAHFDDNLKTLVDDMTETMYAAPGIGLAATQVNVLLRVAVIDVSEEKDALQVFVNPEIISREGEIVGEEGCLSVPGVYESVARSERVRVQAQDLNGTAFELEADGLLAICLQHEIDHLDGKVFVDHLSQLKRSRIRTRLLKRAREQATA